MMLNRESGILPSDYCHILSGRYSYELNNPLHVDFSLWNQKRESDSFYETMRDRNKGVPGIVEDLDIIEGL